LSRKERWRFGALKSDSTHHFFWNACTKSGSLRFWEFSGCWLILSVYILMSFDFCKIVRSSTRLKNLQVWSQSTDWKTFKYDHNQKIEKPSSTITIKRLKNLHVWSQSKDWKTFTYDHNHLKVFQSFDCDHTWRFSNLLIVIILEGFPIFWLWSYLKVFPETRRADLIRYLHVHCFVDYCLYVFFWSLNIRCSSIYDWWFPHWCRQIIGCPFSVGHCIVCVASNYGIWIASLVS
jgi:hypothetical protein